VTHNLAAVSTRIQRCRCQGVRPFRRSKHDDVELLAAKAIDDETSYNDGSPDLKMRSTGGVHQS
jgi:hypothetical protein